MDKLIFSWLVDGSASSYVRQQISVHRGPDQWRQHDAFSWYDQRRGHNTTFLGWSMVGGNTGHSLGVTDKILTRAEILPYTNVGIHNEHTLASTVIGTIGYCKT